MVKKNTTTTKIVLILNNCGGDHSGIIKPFRFDLSLNSNRAKVAKGIDVCANVFTCMRSAQDFFMDLLQTRSLL